MIKYENIIQELIHSKREGDYWDFKREPHSDNASLLLDIICMANSLHKGDRYIIIGVSNDFQVIGLEKKQKNRKSQKELLDIIKEAKFAGDIRPESELITIEIENKEIDIIVIKDRPNKPYFLTENYSYKHNEKTKIVRQHIYTRVGDTNTDIDKSADLYYIEKMWRQRFGLDFTPLERLNFLLQNYNEWDCNFDNKNYDFNTIYPEFTITIDEPISGENIFEPYAFVYWNDGNFAFGNLYFKYHNTILYKTQYVYLDGMQLFLPVPQIEVIESIGKHYYYYDLSSIEGLFLNLLYENKKIQLGGDFTLEKFLNSRCFQNPFLIFKNKNEMIEFESYVETHKIELDAIIPVCIPEPENYGGCVDLEYLCKIKIMFEKWKSMLFTC